MTTSAASGDRSALAFGTDAAELRSVERVIALSRALLAMSVQAVTRLDPFEPLIDHKVADSLLFGYVAVSILLLLILVSAERMPRWLPWLAHAADVMFPVLLAFFWSRQSSPVFTVLLCPLIAAAYRWGLREVIWTAFVIDLLLFAETVIMIKASTVVAALPWLADLVPINPPVNQLLLDALWLRSIYVAALGAAIGYLAENEKRRRFESKAISIVLVRGRAGGKLSDAVLAVLTASRDLFDAKQALLTTRERSSGRTFLWTTDGDSSTGQPVDLAGAGHDDYWFDAPPWAWHATARRLSGRLAFSVVAVDNGGQRTRSRDLVLTKGFLSRHPCRRVLGVTLRLDEDWDARALLIDPGLGVRRDVNARFVLKVALNVAPALYDHFRMRRLRTQAQSVERRRIARELHDGVTQSLLGLEMEVVVLHRHAMTQAPQLADDLVRVHRIVRNEITAVRELMEGVRVVDIDSGDLLRHLSDVVDRFGRYTGVTARFVSDGPPVTLAPHLRREVARIVHEALVNVRKHSGADRVTVRVDVSGRTWKLSIEDDGRGFWFAGRRSQDELEMLRQGPITIAERARSIGAVMTVESRPGFGAKVEVELELPTAADRTHDVPVS